MDIQPNMMNYSETWDNFQLEVPEFFNFTTDIIEKWAEREPKKIALYVAPPHGTDFHTHTFTHLAEMTNQMASFFMEKGIKKGDRVLLMLNWGHEWYVSMLAMIKLGILPVPTTQQCTPRDLNYRINKAEVVGIITNSENRSKIDEIADQCPTLKLKLLIHNQAPGWTNFEEAIAGRPTKLTVEKTRSDDPLLLYFTSGTVAYPKMVLHTQASYAIAHTITARFWHDLTPNDIHWTVTDTGWGKAAWGSLFGQWTQGTALLVHNCPKFEPKTTLQLLHDARITSFCAPPTAYRILVQEDLSQYDFSSIRHCTSAGEPLNPEVIKKWHAATGCRIYDGYGQTETVNVLANFRCMPIRPGSMGKPTPGFEVSIVDDEGTPLPHSTEGHLAIKVKPVRPVGLFKEYWLDEATTSNAFRGDYYFTGDKAYMDEDGYYWFVGRADDVIITSGYRIGPFEVESALIEHPAVMEAAVVSSPNELRGEIVKAFIILAPGHEPSEHLTSELQHHVREITAPYKYPRAIEYVKALPKTISGKIRRGELRAKEWEGWHPLGNATTGDETE